MAEEIGPPKGPGPKVNYVKYRSRISADLKDLGGPHADAEVDKRRLLQEVVHQPVRHLELTTELTTKGVYWG